MSPLGVDFEDHRFASRDEFIALKPSLPFNQVPILEVDGEVFSQSQGLARLAGRLGGLVRRRTVRCVLCTHGSAHTRISQYPEDALEAARVDMITEAVVDLSNGFAKIKYNPALSDEEKVRSCLEVVLANRNCSQPHGLALSGRRLRQVHGRDTPWLDQERGGSHQGRRTVLCR